MMKLINRRPVRWSLMAVAGLVLLAVPVVAQINFSDVESDNPHWDDHIIDVSMKPGLSKLKYPALVPGNQETSD